MICLFDKDETNFDSNGLGVLDPAIKENVVEEKMNGIYNFDFAYLSKGKHASQLEGDMIIKAPTPDGDQLFRVYKVTKNIGFLEVNCYHIFYDLAGNFIEDINIVSQSGQAAITHFGTGLQYATRFKFVSNIVGTNSARMVRLNAVQALLDSSQDNSFLSRWGGEIKRDNFTVYMNDVRGNDKGFKIRHGKNLTGYEANIDYSSVVTRIMPYGYDGLMLPEKYVDSPLRGKYAFTRIKKIEYTNIKAIDPDATSNDEGAVPLEEAYKLLRQAAALEYSVNKVDIPTSNFKVTFKNLADTKEYADFKALEKVEPWDYVTVIADNLDIKSRMISYKYDAITKAYKEVELGNYVPSFTDIGSKVDHANDVANQANDTANSAAESANGKNSNYYGPNEPYKPVDGDLWYKKNGDKTELWQYDGKSVPPGWKLVVDDATGEEVRQNVNAAQKEAEEAKKQANESVAAANDAVAKAGFANDTAEEAKSDAVAAGQQAKDALTNADTALTNAKNALDNVAKLDQTVKTEVTNINGQLAQKVSQTTFDTLKGTVTSQQTEINQNASGIKLKADTTAVNTLKGTVDKQGSAIDVNTKAIALKASQSTVDTLTGRVSTAEGKITVQADQIAQTVSKTELTSKLNGYATQTWTQSQIKSTADSINLSVTKVQNNLDNLAIGGRNYLADTGSPWQAQGSGGANQGRSWQFTFGRIKQAPFNDGEYVTVSFDYTSVGTEAYGTILTQFNNLPWTQFGATEAMKDNGHVVRTVQWQSGWTTSGTATGIRIRMDDVATTRTVTVYNVQFERGNKDTDHKAAPEDMATVEKLSELQVTVNGIQGTVANKADQSQVTQLAGQITSVIGGMGQKNLITNTEFNDLSEWTFGRPELWHLGTDKYYSYKGSNSLVFAGASNTNWTSALSKAIPVAEGEAISASAILFGIGPIDVATPTGTVQIEVDFYDTINGSRQESYGKKFDNASPYAKQLLKLDNIKVPVSRKFVRFVIYIQAGASISIAHPMLVKDTFAGEYQPNTVSESQITQLQSDINLRVQKGDVVNQINISPESILIAGQKVHITGQTTIDNAVIKDAMIADIKADKITAGTLNAANVNVINLNANNITTGTLKGTNLSLNLNTGEVLFQKGSIRSTNGNLNIRIDDGSMSLTNSLGNGAYFKDGNIYMTDSDFWTPGNPKIQYGTLKMVPNFMSDAGGGVALKGPNGVVVGTDKYSDTGIVGDLLSSSPGGGITLTKEHIRMASEGDIGIAGGKMYNSVFGGQLPAIQVGIAGSHTEPTPWSPSSKTGDALFLSGKVVGVVADGGTGDFLSNNISDLSVAGDARSGYVLSTATYKRTYGSGDTVTITPNGVFGRISSASKYKLAIGEISTLNDEAHQFLSVKPKQWFDKSETEALADSMTTGNTDYVDDAKALPHNGFIAEDLYTAGLDSYVIRSNDGSIESIQYDRLPVLHHELIRELFNRLDAAELEIYKLKQEANNAS